jgi:hypothetical protein
MRDMVSNHFGFRPKPDTCCEMCVFGSGEHAPFCVVWLKKFANMFTGGTITIRKPQRYRML